MKKFRVEITASTIYDVEAETEDKAIDKSLEWFENYMPDVYVEEITDNDDDYVKELFKEIHMY